MEIVLRIVQQIPPIWPRIAALLGLALLFFLPEARRFLTHKAFGEQRTEQLKNLLQLRKLELEVAALKAANPEADVSAVDAEIEKMQTLPVNDLEEGESLAWPERARFALAGAFSGMLINSLALWVMSHFDVLEPSQVLLKESVVAVAGGFLASAIPSRARWYCVFRGILIPTIVAALGVTALGHQ
jgi:hypothetical protein